MLSRPSEEADRATAEAAPPTGAVRLGPSYRKVALIVACALLMESIDGTVLTTALPTMARDLRAPVTDLSSALTAYLLALAIFIPASGRLADRFGARTVFRLAILTFLGGSVLCAQATTLPFLIFARFVQGAGGAMMTPVGRLVLLRSAAKAERVQAMSWLVMPALIGPIVGPPLGGYIVTAVNWRWIFYLNLPVGVLGLGLASRYIENWRGPARALSDWRGLALSGACCGGLLFGFETASRSGELVQALLLIAAGLSSGALYVRHAARTDEPILDLSLMRIPTFRLSVIAGSLTRIAQGAQPFLLPLLFQVGFGLSPVQSGAITLATALGFLAMNRLASRLLQRFGFRNCLTVSGASGALGFAICGFFRADWPVPVMFAILVIIGFFMGFQFIAYNAIAYDDIPADRMSAATSAYATVQKLTLSLGVCLGAAVLHVAMLVNGRTRPISTDFTAAFLVVTAISAPALFWNLKFSLTAGQEMRTAPRGSRS